LNVYLTSPIVSRPVDGSEGYENVARISWRKCYFEPNLFEVLFKPILWCMYVWAQLRS